MPVSRTQAAHLLWNDRRFFSIFIDAKEKGGVYKSKTGERERERVWKRKSAIKLLMVVVRNIMRHLHIEYI